MAEDRKARIKDIAPGISFGMASGTVMEVVKKEVEPDAISTVSVSGNPWAIWGRKNDYPQRIIDENSQQETSLGALLFKIFAHFGKGLFFYELDEQADANGNVKEIRKPIKISALPPEIKDFWYNNDLNNFTQGIITDYEWFYFYHTQYIPNKAGNKIVRIKWQRTKDVRAQKRDLQTGDIQNYFLSPYWADQNRPKEYAQIPAFDDTDPFRFPNAIRKHQLVSVDKDYYPTAHWQSNFRWLSVAKKIPLWIDSSINNAANIKYHVEIPEQYFLDLYPDTDYESAEAARAARKAAEEELKKEIDNCLAGAENPQKIFYTKFAIDKQTMQPIPGWKINILENKLNDGAWLQAYGTSAAAICTAHGVPPSLTGLITPSALNVGSGSDTREKFNFYMQLKTVIPRQTTLEWWELVKRVNQWPEDIHLGYRNVILDTLDKAKGGTQTENEENPTTANKEENQ
jgi:hypothetical protein